MSKMEVNISGDALATEADAALFNNIFGES